jgi:hypothetical protein
VTVRRLVLPLGAVIVLVFGVYLFLAVRAQPEPPEIARSKVDQLPRPARRADPLASPALAETPAEALPSSSDRPPPVPLMRSEDPPPEAVAGSGAEAEISPLKLNAMMKQANLAYDREDFDQAKAIAGKVLDKDPTNARMLRVIVSASCIEGEAGPAQANFAKLPPDDQEQMRVRCARYGITFP